MSSNDQSLETIAENALNIANNCLMFGLTSSENFKQFYKKKVNINIHTYA